MMTVFESQSHIHHGQHATIDIVPQLLLAAPFIVVSLLYLVGYFLCQSRYKRWPLPRIIFWMLGNGCAIASVLGPIADRAHADFTVHMLAHLLLGMLGPLLMVLGAPMSLLLRTLPVIQAKKITRLLRTRYFQFMTGPVVTSILNIGGLWLLYTTDLYSMMHQSTFLHVFIH